MKKDYLDIKGAKQHNLKNLDLKIPKNQLIVFTGLSGSGKSSLAFDTIYAEGQRRYVESLSSYARQFLGLMTKPDVEQIDGLSPAIAIDQKTTSHNPRSTVGTITEIYDYLRLLYARIGHPHCPKCGREISTQSLQQIENQILKIIKKQTQKNKLARFMILSPIIRRKKGEFTDLFKNLKSQGIQRVRVDKKIHDLKDELILLKNNYHTIEAVIERLTFSQKQSKSSVEIKTLKTRLSNSIETALKLSNGLVILTQIKDPSLEFPINPQKQKDTLFSEHLACPQCRINIEEIEPRIFSFNSPYGACPTCHGLGTLLKIDPNKMIAPNLTVPEGAIIPFASQMQKDSWHGRILRTLLKNHSNALKTPWKKLPQKLQKQILYGSHQKLYVKGLNKKGLMTGFTTKYQGAVNNLKRRYQETQSDFIKTEIEKYMTKEICPDCQGDRLKPESLSVTIDKLNISQLTQLSIKDCFEFLNSLNKTPSPLSAKEKQIGQLILKEILTRLKFLISVGLDYLTLSRESATLAGGEAQRIRLASQIGTGLTGVLYILDEPSIGLHQRDNQRLIKTLKQLKNLGNSIIVVEHDQGIILSADQIIDFGPLAGKSGGEIVFQGSVSQLKRASCLTAKYLKNQKKVIVPSNKSISLDQKLTLKGAKQHNLKNIDVSFPLNNLIVVTGVSGSGKSSLIHDTLYYALKNKLQSSHLKKADNYRSLSGYHSIDHLSLIDQSPIGRTPRSNPATYTKAFDYIRSLFSLTKEAKIKGYQPGRFSFNVKGGRCEACRGDGQVKIEMQFMPDVYITCDVCRGRRYNQPTLEVEYQAKNISEVLSMTVDEAIKFFPAYSPLQKKLLTLQQVGLGYIELGQPAPTLSGGEAQRIKLAKELSKTSRGHTLYLLDEPTTGLHFEDLKKLLIVLKKLVEKGNTVIIIEHNLDIIKNADWIIDLGPEGGDQGGQIVFSGPLEKILKNKKSYTAQFLKKHFNQKNV